jgi:hypothetical protein
MASWGFTTCRGTLAAVNNPSTTWLYAYAVPSGMIHALAVLPSDALDDYTENWAQQQPSLYPEPNYSNPAANFYTPQPFATEIVADGSMIILTNVASAVLRYTRAASDPTQFPALFVMALSYLLASMLAGPILKGDAGSAKSKEMLGLSQVYMAQAEGSDADERRIVLQQSVPWMARR